MDFFKDIDDIKHSFHIFASQTAPDGQIIINGDMTHTADILNGLPQKAITFGLNADNDYTAKDISYDREGNGSYTLVVRGEELGHISLKVKGAHNVMNSLAAIACSRAIGLSMEQITNGLLAFSGTHRRFEQKGTIGDVIVIDDYAHHPTEIRATLKRRPRIPARRIMGCLPAAHLHENQGLSPAVRRGTLQGRPCHPGRYLRRQRAGHRHGILHGPS